MKRANEDNQIPPPKIFRPWLTPPQPTPPPPPPQQTPPPPTPPPQPTQPELPQIQLQAPYQGFKKLVWYVPLSLSC